MHHTRERQKTGGQLLREAVEQNHWALIAKKEGDGEKARSCWEHKLWLACLATLENPREIGWTNEDGVIIIHQRGENRKKRWPRVPIPIQAMEAYLANNDDFYGQDAETLRRRLESAKRGPKQSGRTQRCRKTGKPWQRAMARY